MSDEFDGLKKQKDEIVEKQLASIRRQARREAIEECIQYLSDNLFYDSPKEEILRELRNLKEKG